MTYYDCIPNDLKQLRQWVCCHDSKVPMRATADDVASSADPGTWSDFQTAARAVQDGRYEYIGFVFHDNGIIGIDLDHCIDGVETSEQAVDIVSHCHSYCETSKSGTGIHIYVKGNIPFDGRNNHHGVEIYKTGRFFIMTGNMIRYNDVIDNQEALDYIIDKYFPDVIRTTKDLPKMTQYTPRYTNAIINGAVQMTVDYPPIACGERNMCLTSLAGQLYQSGYAIADIFKALLQCNSQACEKPLPRFEIERIVTSVQRYKR